MTGSRRNKLYVRLCVQGHIKAYALFRASKAWMTGTNWPGSGAHIAEQD